MTNHGHLYGVIIPLIYIHIHKNTTQYTIIIKNNNENNNYDNN